LKEGIVEGVVKRFLHYREKGGSPYPIRDVNTIDGVRSSLTRDGDW